MKSIRQIYSLLFWGIALIVITLFNSCGPHVAPAEYYIYLNGNKGGKIEINYFDGSNKTEVVNLPYYKLVLVSDNSSQFYLKICDTTSSVKAMVIVPTQRFDSCFISNIDTSGILYNKNTPVYMRISNSNGKEHAITFDSLFVLMKKKYPKSYIERTTENKYGCLTATPY
jgi:hypothetical protein